MTLSALLLGSLILVFAGCEENGEVNVDEVSAAPVTGATVTPVSATATVDEQEQDAPAQKNQEPKQDEPAGSAEKLIANTAAQDDQADEPARRAAEGISDGLVVVEPSKLEFGDIPTNDSARGMVRLVNTGDTPRSLIKCNTSCGCTAVNCPTDKVINPGEEVEIEVKLDGGARDGAKLNKTVTFLLSDGHPPIQLPVAAQAVAFVTIEPAEIDPDLHADGRIVLTAIDDQPFTIKSMYPPMIEEFSAEPAAEHVIYFPWDKWQEEGHRQRKLLFTLDHPKCPKVYGQVSIKGIPRIERPTASERTRITAGIDLDKMLMNKKDEEVLQLLLDGRIEIGSPDKTGQTPLIKASRWGRPEVVQAFLDASANIEHTDSIGRTALVYACQSKSPEAVRVLLDAGAEVATVDMIGNGVLCYAAGVGTPEIMEMLLEAGAPVEIESGSEPAATEGQQLGFTPLIWAAGFGGPESIRLLIDAGADVEVPDKIQGATPLMHATRTGGAENVKVLLEAGADLEAVNREGQTALLVACSNAGADVEVVKMLIDAGADLSRTTHTGKNALDLARSRTDLRAADVEKYLAEVMGVASSEEEAAVETGAGTE